MIVTIDEEEARIEKEENLDTSLISPPSLIELLSDARTHAARSQTTQSVNHSLIFSFGRSIGRTELVRTVVVVVDL